MKSGLTLIPRPDLSKDSTDFESVWVEIENSNGKNYLFCCAYRHPQWAKMVILQTFVDVSRELNVTGAVGSSF